MRIIAKELLSDPRVAQAKQLLHDALEDAKKSIQSPSPPQPDLKQQYEELLQQACQVRGGKLWYPYLGSGLGNGPLVELLDGSIKYDFISGIGTHHFGHNHPELLDSSIDAALANTIQQGHLQQNEDSIQLMQSLLDLANKNEAQLDHCFLSTSGAMANENALKIIFQKKNPANRILSFSQCFSGRTLALAQLTDKAAYRQGLPTSLHVDYVPFLDLKNPEASTQRTLRIIEDHIQRYPGQHAAMCFELVQGEGGYYAGTTGFFTSIIELLRQHSIAVWIDEIQTFGRLSEPFAFQHYKLDQLVDVITIGKMSQVCATLFSADFAPKPGLLSQTFTSSTQAIRGAQKLVKALQSEQLVGANGKNMRFHKIWQDRCSRMKGLSGPYGIGAMFAFTLKDGSPEEAMDFTHRLFNNGVISFIAGKSPTRIRFLPPMICLTEEDIHKVCDIIEQTLQEL